MSVKLNSSGGGSITLQEPSTASNRTLTLPDNTGTVVSTASTGVITQAMIATGVAGNGPAFSAYLGSNQNFSTNVSTKLICGTERFDTASCYDASTGRFTPNIAGYYQINARANMVGSSFTYGNVAILKNGTNQAAGTNSSVAVGQMTSFISDVVYLNGSTDYVEFYVFVFNSSTTPYVNASGPAETGVSAVLVRAA